MYYLGDYVWMLTDRARVDAYAAAIRAVVRPGDRVLEIGAGFGFFSVLAARAGAAHVDAVESNPVGHLGPRVARDNGCDATIAFHLCDSRELTLPDRVDVIVADLRGPMPMCGASLETMIDARDRLLRPGGRIVPLRDTLFACPCTVPRTWRTEVEAAHGLAGVNMDAVERVVYDTPLRCTIEREALLAAPRPWATIDYAAIGTPDVAGECEWVLDRDAEIAGVGVWFEGELAPGVRVSTAPPADTVYARTFVPFAARLQVRSGDTLRVALAARAARTEYIWEWRAWLNGTMRADQNSLAERIIHPAALRAARPNR